jgi:hypothetical protein
LNRTIAAVSAFYGLVEAALSRRHDHQLTRPVAAWLCRRRTVATLREMGEWLGISRADSVPNPSRRLEARLKTSPELCADLIEIFKLANEPAERTGSASTDSTRAPLRSSPPKTRNKARPREALRGGRTTRRLAASTRRIASRSLFMAPSPAELNSR